MAHASDDVEVGILGRIRATVAERDVDLGGPRQQALLAALACEPGRTVTNDFLIDVIWDGEPPDGAARTFRSYVARLRRSFDRAGVDGATVVLTDSAGYRLDDSVEVDAALFEAEVSHAREQLAAGDFAAAVRLSTHALERWEGRAFGLFADREWAVPTGVRLEELRLGATELRGRALLDADRVALAVPLLEELAAAEPYREAVARLHALALYRSDRDVDAIRVIREFRDRLADEYGLDPSEALAELELMVLNRDPRLDRPVGGRGLRGLILHEPIARSPLGTVHRAEQPSIGREVAVTVLSPDLADDPDVVRAFEARLQAVAGLDHPHLLPVYDYWRQPGGAYVVTRLPAATLEQTLRAGRITVADALRLGEQVASALAAAHERDVIHGALGADAVVVDDRGDAFLWGFALTGDAGRAARDVAMLATLVTRMVEAGQSRAADAVDSGLVPTPARSVLARAADPGRGAGVTAAALAVSLSAARAGAVEVPAVPVEVGPNPYRGLAAFRETDTDVFFGRAALTEQLMARLRRSRAVAVVGPSGCGKSSVVRAGVLPRLRAEGAFVTTMLPGTHPLAELEIALSRISATELVDAAEEAVATPNGLSHLIRRVRPTADAEVVLVVDQVEELFTLSDPTERDLFLAAVADVVADHDSPLRVIVTLRADFLAAALTHPTAGPLIRDRTVMVGPLDGDDLHEVIIRPAESAGVAVEPALAVALVADAVRAPGSLPMVQFALTEVFAAASDDGLMTADAYRRIGGIEGVLGQRAEEVFASLAPEDQHATHALFQRLVTINDDAPPTRRRALRTELSRVPDRVIEAFGRARLLRFDHEPQSREPTVEVSHEAIFHAWARLRAWIEEGADDLRVLGHLTHAAGEWHAGDREEGELYRGSRLDTALDYAGSRRAQLSGAEVAFLDAARRRRDGERASARQTVRRLRVLTGSLAAGLVIAMVAGGVAWQAGQQESEARRREQATARSAQVDELAFAASGEVAEDPERASLLAAHAYAIEPDIESQAALLDVLDVEPRIVSIRPTPSDTCSERTGVGDVVLFHTISLEGEVLELRTLDQDVLQRFTPEPSTTFSCAGVTPSADHVFVRHFDRYEVHDLDMQPVASRDDVLAPDDQQSLDFDPTRPEATLVLDSGDVAIVTVPELETLRLLDVDLDAATGGAGQAVQGSGGGTGRSLVRAVAYSEDASQLAVADVDTVHVVDDRGGLVASMDASPHPSGGTYPFVSTGAGAFGYVGSRSLVVAPLGSPDDQVEIELRGATTPYRRGVAIEPGGRRAAVATQDGIEIVDLVDAAPEGEPIPVDANIVDLFWSGEGRLNGLGPNGVYQLEVDRALLLGTLDAEVPIGGDRNAAAVASDGSGMIVDDIAVPMSRYLGQTGATVDLGAAVVAVPLDGGRWFALDTATGIAATGDSSGTDAASDIPGVADVEWDVAQIDVVADRAVVLLRDTTADATSADRSTILILDANTGEIRDVVEPPTGTTYTAAVAVGDRNLLLADLNYRWTVVDAELTVVDGPRVPGPGQEVAAVDEGSGRYVTADWNGDLHVVDPDRDVVLDLPGPASFAVDVAFAGEHRLVSRHIDGSTYLWDIPDSRLVGRLWRSPPFGSFGMAVDREANELLQMTAEGLARIPLETDAWFDAVCSRVDRRLTAAELAAIAPDLGPGPGCPE